MNKKVTKKSEAVTKKKTTTVKKTTVKPKTTVKKTVSTKKVSTPKKVKAVEAKKIETIVVEPVETPKKRKIEKVTDSEKLYIYGALITIILVLSNSIVSIPFEVFGVVVKLSSFFYPLTFLISCIILKKYGVMEVIEALVVAVVVQLLMFFLRWIIVGNINVGLFISSFVAFGVGQVACLCLYNILERNKMDKNILYVFLVFTICVLFDNGVFLSLLKNFGDSTATLNSLNISNGIRVMISFLMAYFITEVKW